MNQENIINVIISTINTIFSNIFSSIDSNLYESLDDVTFIDSNILKTSIFEKLLNSSGNYTLIYLADSMLVACLIFYIIKYYYSNFVETDVEKPSQFIFKLIIFSVFVNFSYFLFEQLLDIAYFISGGIQEIGKSATSHEVTFQEFIKFVNKKSYMSGELNLFSFDGILKSFVTVQLLELMLSYSLRYILLQTLILLSPFIILSLINRSTSWIFKAWGKCILYLIMIQVFIPIVLIIIFSIDDSNRILFIAGLYALTRLNSYVREMFGGISLDVGGSFTSMLSGFKI